MRKIRCSLFVRKSLPTDKVCRVYVDAGDPGEMGVVVRCDPPNN